MNGSGLIANKLLTVSAVTALIGTRCRPDMNPETDTLPYIEYQESGSIDFETHNGSALLMRENVQLQICGTTYASVDAVINAVRNAINFQRGTWSGCVVQGCFMSDKIDTIDFINPDVLVKGKQITFEIFFQPS